jgi:hypothetical protein
VHLLENVVLGGANDYASMAPAAQSFHAAIMAERPSRVQTA